MICLQVAGEVLPGVRDCAGSALVSDRWVVDHRACWSGCVSSAASCSEAAGCVPCWAAMDGSAGKARFQQPYDLFFGALAVVVSIYPIMNATRFIPQEAVNQSFGTLGFDEGHKSPYPEIVWRAVHVLTTRELGTFPTAL
jgi:hypothetical protein